MKTGKSKKADSFMYCQGMRMMDVAAYVYMFLLLGVYPLVYDDHYFNITITKYHFFMFASGVYLILAILGYIVEANMRQYYHYKPLLTESISKKRYFRPEFWMLAFLMANLFAWFCAPDKKDAFYGTQGRHMGLLAYFILAAVFLLLAFRYRPHMVCFVVFSASSAFAYIVAICQHMENDFLDLKYHIAENQYTKFISTFGNINIYACFLSISIPVFLAVYVFAKEWYYRMIAGTMLVVGGINILISNSDSVFVGLFAGFFVLGILAYMQGRLRYFCSGVFWVMMGNLILGVINRYAVTRYDEKRGGLAIVLNRLDFALFACIVVLVVYLLVRLAGKVWRNKLESLNKKKVVWIFCSACAVFFVVFVIFGIKSGSSFFRFDDKWGSYRGYIWRKIVEVYGDAPAVNKLFGYGNETVRVTLKSVCYNEMVSVTGKVYDNAHNELLQYLFTLGIVGLLSYLGLVISSVVYMIKNAHRHIWICVCIGATVSYFAQSILNLNQPITTPYFFAFLAMGVGTVNYCKRLEEIGQDVGSSHS